MKFSKAFKPEKVFKDFKMSQNLDECLVDNIEIDDFKIENLESIFFEKLHRPNVLQFLIQTKDENNFRLRLKEESVYIPSLKRYVKKNFKVI